MKVIFAGTPDFAAAALKAIASAGFEIPLVLTQPDRPKGRGMQLTASPVKQAALELGLTVAQPEKLRNNAEALQMLKDTGADVMVVAAYGLILPQEVLDTPKHGCLNIHASLLPRWRGAAPIQRAIEARRRRNRRVHHADGHRLGHRRCGQRTPLRHPAYGYRQRSA